MSENPEGGIILVLFNFSVLFSHKQASIFHMYIWSETFGEQHPFFIYMEQTGKRKKL